LGQCVSTAIACWFASFGHHQGHCTTANGGHLGGLLQLLEVMGQPPGVKIIVGGDETLLGLALSMRVTVTCLSASGKPANH